MSAEPLLGRRDLLADLRLLLGLVDGDHGLLVLLFLLVGFPVHLQDEAQGSPHPAEGLVRVVLVLLGEEDPDVEPPDLAERRAGLVCKASSDHRLSAVELAFDDETGVEVGLLERLAVRTLLLVPPGAPVGDDRDARLAGVEVGKRDDGDVLVPAERLRDLLRRLNVDGELRLARSPFGELALLLLHGSPKDSMEEPVVPVEQHQRRLVELLDRQERDRNRNSGRHEPFHDVVVSAHDRLREHDSLTRPEDPDLAAEERLAFFGDLSRIRDDHHHFPPFLLEGDKVLHRRALGDAPFEILLERGDVGVIVHLRRPRELLKLPDDPGETPEFGKVLLRDALENCLLDGANAFGKRIFLLPDPHVKGLLRRLDQDADLLELVGDLPQVHHLRVARHGLAHAEGDLGVLLGRLLLVLGERVRVRGREVDVELGVELLALGEEPLTLVVRGPERETIVQRLVTKLEIPGKPDDLARDCGDDAEEAARTFRDFLDALLRRTGSIRFQEAFGPRQNGHEAALLGRSLVAAAVARPLGLVSRSSLLGPQLFELFGDMVAHGRRRWLRVVFAHVIDRGHLSPPCARVETKKDPKGKVLRPFKVPYESVYIISKKKTPVKSLRI